MLYSTVCSSESKFPIFVSTRLLPLPLFLFTLSYSVAPQTPVEWRVCGRNQTRKPESRVALMKPVAEENPGSRVRWGLEIICYNYPCPFNTYVLCYRSAGLPWNFSVYPFGNLFSWDSTQPARLGWEPVTAWMQCPAGSGSRGASEGCCRQSGGSLAPCSLRAQCLGRRYSV